MRFTQPIVVLGALLLVSAARAAGGPVGQLCFVRGEDHGMKSAHPISIWGEHDGKSRKLVELKKQKKACVSVPIGTWTIDARSTYPGTAKSSDPNACRSSPLTLEVTKDPVVPIAISPLGGGPTTMCGWDLR